MSSWSHINRENQIPIMGILKTENVDHAADWEGRTTSPSLAGPHPHPHFPDEISDQKYLGDQLGHRARDQMSYMEHHKQGGNMLLPVPTKSEIDINGAGDGSDPPLCAGCRIRITDKFYLCAVERKWHSSCLKCNECGSELENEASCFEREGQIYCKDDYLRLYGSARACARCRIEISHSDLVMKARHCIFHTDCFRCATCDSSLRKGDLFGMFEDVLYCRLHFEMITTYGHSGDPLNNCHPPLHSPEGDLYPPGMPHQHPGMFVPGTMPGFSPGGHPEHWPYGPGPEFGPMCPDYQFNNNNEPIKKRRGRKKRKVDEFAAMNGYMEGYPQGMDGHGVGQSKSKRARTSFKHHQLRIMKSHFQVNQNPDSRELKMLSQKTGLDKKILQVWFQNARAKWRRMNANGGATIENVLGPDGDDMKVEDMSPGDCGGQDSMISCC